jgi:hypothetical protein
MKKGIINQYGGLGDIIFCYKIANYLIQNKLVDIVEWPVPQHYLHLNNYFINENIIFCEKTPQHESLFTNKEVIDNANFLYLPLGHHTQGDAGEFDMSMKYKFLPFNITPKDRHEPIVLKRNPEREEKLINHISSQFSFDFDSKFNLINVHFGTPPNHCSVMPSNTTLEQVTQNNMLPFLKIEYLGFCRVFDWIPLLLKCEKFYTVETSFTHLFHLLQRKNAVVFPRYCPATNNTNKSLNYCRKYYNEEWNQTWEFLEI